MYDSLLEVAAIACSRSPRRNIMPAADEDFTDSQSQGNTQKEGGEVILSASLPDVAPFVALMKAISGLSNTASLIFSKAGIQIEVEYKRALQATAYLASSLFDEWFFEPPTLDNEDDTMEPGSYTTEIEINLGILNEVLSIYGSSGGGSSWRKKGRGDDNEDDEDIRGPLDRFMIPRKAATSMRMSYAGEGYPLRLSLAESAEGPTTVCQIHTLVSERRMELTFDDEDKIVKIIMKSTWLRDALSEIDSSCDYITIICNPPQKVTRAGKGREEAVEDSFFRIEARMQRGSVEMDYPNDREVLEFFECGGPVKFNYSFDVIQRAVRALSVSVKVSIRIDGDGVMSLQFLMPTESSGERKTWMEFRFLARDDNL